METTGEKNLSRRAKALKQSGSTTQTSELEQAQEYLEVNLDDLLDHLINWASNYFGEQHLVTSRDTFDERTGKAFHSDTFFEERTQYFFDDYLFSRSAKDHNRTPFQIYEEAVSNETIALPFEVQATFDQLHTYRHSIFLVAKSSTKTMIVKDLLSEEEVLSVVAEQGDQLAGFEKGSLVQGHIFQIGQTYRLSRGYIVHGKPLGRLIKSEVEIISSSSKGKSSRDLLESLARRHLRALRHKHVDGLVIYKSNP